MAPQKKASTSQEAAKQIEARALQSAPTFYQPEDVESLAEDFPTGVALVRQIYRTESGSEFTSRGQALPYEEVIPQTNNLIISMTKAIADPRTGVMIPGREIVEAEKLPFRTDNCAMVRKHRFKSVEVLHSLMGMEGYNNVFEMIPITEAQLAAEKAIGKAGREELLRNAEAAGMGDKTSVQNNFAGVPMKDQPAPAAAPEKRKPGRPKSVKREEELVEA